MKYILFTILLSCTFALAAQVTRSNILCTTDHLAQPFDYRATNDNLYEIRITFNFADFIDLPSDATLEALVTEVNEYFFVDSEGTPLHNIMFNWDCQKTYAEGDVTTIDNAGAIDVNVYALFGDSSAEFIPDTKIKISMEDLNAESLSHELGHCLGLLHTHTSTGPDPEGPSTGATTCSEDPDGTTFNCMNCGDCLCETPADPDLSTPGYLSACSYVGTATYNGQPYDPDVTNIMSYASGCRDHFVPAQGTRMRNFLEHVPYLQKVLIHRDQSVSNMTLQEGESLNIAGKVVALGNFVAFEGSSVVFVEDGAELVAEGESLLLLGCQIMGCNWKSITITNDCSGVVTNSTFLGGEVALLQEHSSTSVLEVRGNTFSGSVVGLSLKNRSLANADIVQSNIFKSGEVGILARKFDGSIKGNKFVNLTRAGIDASDSHLTITNCETSEDFLCYNVFENCEYGIIQSFPSGLSESVEISNYQFLNSAKAAVMTLGGSSSTSSKLITISNNSVEGASVGFSFSGATRFLIENNTIENVEYATFCNSTGADANFIVDNSLDGDGYIGSVFLFNNKNNQTRANCYGSHSRTDIFVHDLYPDQGAEESSNGNCFGSTNRELETSSANSSFYAYYEPSNAAGGLPCQDVNAIGNFVILEADDTRPSDECGVNTIGGSSTEGDNANNGPGGTTSNPPVDPTPDPCHPEENEVSILAAQQQLLSLLDDTENNTNYTAAEKHRLVIKYQNCLRNNYMLLNDIYLEGVGTQRAIDSLAVREDFTLRVKGYTMLVEEQLYAVAQQYLMTIGATSTAETDFVFAQQLYLQSKQDSLYFPTSSDLDAVETIAEGTDAIDGYARAVYHWFTGVIVEVPYDFGTVKPRSTENGTGRVATAIVYPSICSIGEPVRLRYDDAQSISYHIYDMQGVMVSNGVARSEEQIATPDRAGLYYITIPEWDFVEKFIIIK